MSLLQIGSQKYVALWEKLRLCFCRKQKVMALLWCGSPLRMPWLPLLSLRGLLFSEGKWKGSACGGEEGVEGSWRSREGENCGRDVPKKEEQRCLENTSLTSGHQTKHLCIPITKAGLQRSHRPKGEMCGKGRWKWVQKELPRALHCDSILGFFLFLISSDLQKSWNMLNCKRQC